MAVRKAVRDYNDALAKAYYEISVSPLADVASIAERHRNEIIMEKMRYEKTRMRSSIQEFHFGEVRVENDGSAYALTIEKWSVEKLNVETGDMISPKEIIEYRLEYLLKRTEDGRWIVDSVGKVVRAP